MTLEVLGQSKIGDSNQSEEYSLEVDTLGPAAQFSIFAVRVWSSAAKQKLSMDYALGQLFRDFRCTEVLGTFDECMSLIAVSALRPINIGCCPSNRYVVGDEAMMLNCFRALERDDPEAALAEIDQVMIHSLKPTFCRIAKRYVLHLNKMGLNFRAQNKLSLV